MNLPSGLVFYLDFKYGTSQPGFETGAGKDSQTDSVFGITETAETASQGLYGAGRFGYSVNETASLPIVNSGQVKILTWLMTQVQLLDLESSITIRSSQPLYAGQTLRTVSVPVSNLRRI